MRCTYYVVINVSCMVICLGISASLVSNIIKVDVLVLNTLIATIASKHVVHFQILRVHDCCLCR